jgi:hypothetical protein
MFSLAEDRIMMEFRNPVFSAEDNSRIDMEVNHPVYGWISFTASPDDISADGRALYAAAYDTAGPYVTPPPPDPPPPYLNNGGLIRFTGVNPPETLEAIRMSGATRVAKGRYRSYHEEAYPSDQYSAIPSVFDANPRIIRVTARTTTYVEVRVTDLAGAAQDPQEITIKTERVVTNE